MISSGALQYLLSKFQNHQEKEAMEAQKALEYSVRNSKSFVLKKAAILPCLKSNNISIDDDIDEIDENTEIGLRAWRNKRQKYVNQARQSFSSFRQHLMSESRVSSIDMDFWRVMASQNDRVTMMIVMFVVKCRFSSETSKAMDLFQNWKEYGGDC